MLEKDLIQRRLSFMARSGEAFDKVSIFYAKYLGLGQKHSYQRIPDKLLHYVYDSLLKLKYGDKIKNTGNAYESIYECRGKFAQHHLHRGFYYDKDKHSLVGTATGIDINVSNGKHHIIELNRSIGILEAIRPIYKTEYGPEIYSIVAFAKKYQFRKVYVMYSRLHLYKQEFLDASKAFDIELVPVSYPWVEFDKERYSYYFMPSELESDTLYMRLEPGYSPIMHYISDKYVSYKWLKTVFDSDPDKYSLISVPQTTNYLRVNPQCYTEKWPTTVIKLSGKMQGQAIFMLKAKSEQDALRFLNVSSIHQRPKLHNPGLSEKCIDLLFGNDKTIIYQDFVPPSTKDGIAGRIRINIFVNPLESIPLSDYYMWTAFKAPEICPDGFVKSAEPYIVNWKYSGKKAQFVTLNKAEREATDAATPQICDIVARGIEDKFISTPDIGTRNDSI